MLIIFLYLSIHVIVCIFICTHLPVCLLFHSPCPPVSLPLHLLIFPYLYLLSFLHSSTAVPERGHQQGPRGGPCDRSRPHLEDQRKRRWLDSKQRRLLIPILSHQNKPHCFCSVYQTMFSMVKCVWWEEVLWRMSGAESGITGSIAGVSCRPFSPEGDVTASDDDAQEWIF